MRDGFRATAAAFMLAGGVTLASAASAQTGAPAGAASDQLSLTQAQETTILLRLENEPAQRAAAPPAAGTPAPDGLTLERLPSDVGAQIPEAERFHYAKLEDRVLLVDPGSKQVVKVIRPQATTSGSVTGPGSATSGSAGGIR
jgi:hypothetical protein